MTTSPSPQVALNFSRSQYSFTPPGGENQNQRSKVILGEAINKLIIIKGTKSSEVVSGADTLSSNCSRFSGMCFVSDCYHSNKDWLEDVKKKLVQSNHRTGWAVQKFSLVLNCPIWMSDEEWVLLGTLDVNYLL